MSIPQWIRTFDLADEWHYNFFLPAGRVREVTLLSLPPLRLITQPDHQTALMLAVSKAPSRLPSRHNNGSIVVSAAFDPTVGSRVSADRLLRTEPQVFCANNHLNNFISHP
jgi:hypothetical protein